MKVLVLSECLFVAVLLQYPGDAARQFTAAPPTCPGDTITFECTVGVNPDEVDGVTLWRVSGGGGSCSLFHKTSIATSTCGPGNAFMARFENVSATSYPSTLSGTASPVLNGTSIKCVGPAFPGTTVGSSSIQIVGPPSIPTLSRVDFSEDTNGTVKVTVMWTLSSGPSADFYLINITTNDTQPPYGGLLNITDASVTQRELTGFQAGYEYNITLRGVNCGSQEGSVSEPLTITPQVPAIPVSDVCAVYDRTIGTLHTIESTWDEVDPVTLSEDYVNGRDIRSSYELAYVSSSGTSTTTCKCFVNGTDCRNDVCQHELQNNTVDSSCDPPLHQFSGENVTLMVTAKNIVGISNPAVSRNISVINTVLEVRVHTTNPGNASVGCIFEPGYTCAVEYGTDSSYTNLIYRDNSTTLGQIAIITLSQELQEDTTYYFIVTATSSSQCLKMRGIFRTECIELDLGITAPEDVMTDKRCVDKLFMNSSSIISGVVCYNGTTAISEAVYICDDNSSLIGEATRVCQNDGMWNGSIPQCIPVCILSEWHYALIVIGAFVLVVEIALSITVIAFSCCKEVVNKVWRRNSCIPISLLVNAGLFLPIVLVLWIALGAVISNPSDKDPCQPWHSSRDGLVISGFVFSILLLTYDIAALSWVVYHVKPGEQPYGKCFTCCAIVMIVLLCLSVIGIPFAIMIAVLYFKKTEKCDTKEAVGSGQFMESKYTFLSQKHLTHATRPSESNLPIFEEEPVVYTSLPPKQTKSELGAWDVSRLGTPV